MTRKLTARMKVGLPPVRELYRVGDRELDVLVVLWTRRVWGGSQASLCRLIASERDVTTRTVAYAVRSLTEKGLIIGPRPLRLTIVGEQYARLRFRPRPNGATSPQRSSAPAAPPPALAPIVRQAAFRPAPAPSPSSRFASPVFIPGPPRRCSRCGFDELVTLANGRPFCRICDREP